MKFQQSQSNVCRRYVAYPLLPKLEEWESNSHGRPYPGGFCMPCHTWFLLKLIHTARQTRQDCLVCVASVSAAWIGFMTTQDCRRHNIWSLNTLIATVQFTPPRQTRQDCHFVRQDCHFVRLANTLLKDGESARDNHVLACNFAKYSPILIFFTARLSNKSFLIRLLTTLPRLKYIATLPCNLLLIACSLTLMFHKVVWQHV